MKSLGLLGARLVLGGYLAVHGAQKLFGWFGGRGLEGTAAGFERIGLRPGKAMAALAGANEFGGGILTATGIAYPLGPIVIVGTMAIASTTHRAKGPLMSDGGFELPLTNLAAAAALAVAGPGKLRLGPNLSPRLVRRAVLVGAVLGGVSAYQLLNPRPAVEAPAGPPDAADPDSDSHGMSHTHSESESNSHTGSHSESESHTGSHRESESNSHSGSHSESDADTNSESASEGD